MIYREHTNRRVSLTSPWLAISLLTSNQTGIYITTEECRTQPATSSLLLLGPSPHGWQHLIFLSNIFTKIPLCLDCSSLVLTLFSLPAFLIWGKCVGSLSWLDSALAGLPGLTSRKSSQVPTKTGPQVVHADLRSSHSLDPNMEGTVERKEPWIWNRRDANSSCHLAIF